MTELNDIISVITVVFNGKDFIERTIKSVLEQDYAFKEYIIIDGGSTDGTVDIIKKYESHLLFWSSEPDRGVYDAMNKGIEKASGKWINFMNAGDYFYSNEVLSQIFSNNRNTARYDVVYGDTEFRLGNIAYVSIAGNNVDSNGFMPFSHQAAFVKTDIAKAYKFELKYKITADTAFFLRLVIDKKKMKHIPVIVCSYDASRGLSADNEVKRSIELVDMQSELNGADPNSPYFKKYIRNARIRQFLRRLTPTSIWLMMRKRNAKKNNTYEISENR